MGLVRILSGGAAHGLVNDLAQQLAARGLQVEGTFGAVGAMRDKLLAGEPCDLVILSQALVDELQAQGHVVSGSARPIGKVRTGIAVKAGEPLPQVSDRDSLRALLAGARALYTPDTVKSTAGQHVAKVLRQLGLEQQMAGKLREYPNGATAMRELAACGEAGLVGCTQFTEILYTPGVQLAGGLPAEFELATVYTAAVCTAAANPADAAALAQLLASEEAAPQRKSGGFDPL
jgi:molybdate transport system substrate-binding protein